MCTAATYTGKDHYFGRNLDLEYSYNEQVTVMPRNFPLKFRHADTLTEHFAMIGMAYVVDGYPLYYDATNECGLSMAGLNFPGNADYKKMDEDADDGIVNITSFEFVPWILSQCSDVFDARAYLDRINLIDENFSDQLPNSPLHWIIADQKCSIVVECVKDGLKVYDNPVGVMTNNPTFDYQLFNLNNYMQVSKEPSQNTFAEGLDLDQYSRGMGGIGIPGDLSSASRFVKVAFTRMNSLPTDTESASISQFFHILGSVDQQKGCVHLGGDKYEYTIYSSCCNMDRGIYYYTTYENSQISAVDMNKEDLDSDQLVTYPLIEGQQIHFQN